MAPEHWALRVAASTASWDKKLRRIAAVKRVVSAMMLEWQKRRGGGGASVGGGGGDDALDPRILFPLDSEALSDAEKLLWRATQRRSFGDAASRKKLAALNPFEADDGLLRCGGRLARSVHLSYDARCPIILPHDSADVKDLLRHLHISLLHAGVD